MRTNQLQQVIASNLVDGSAESNDSNQVARSGVQPMEIVLSYEFPDLVDRIQKDLNVPADQAHALFKDMLQFLYVCGSNRGERPPFYPPRYIDEAWHTFLLFTREYDAFCRYYFGTFIHHSPVTPTNRAKHRDTPKNLVFTVAREIFGELSDNWKVDAADCPQSCSPSHDDHG
jgi:hypothetical protein